VTSPILRFPILILIAWANLYCCCGAPAAVPAEAQHAKSDCCAKKHSQQPPSEPRQHDGRKCDECPFFAIRQKTIVAEAHHALPPPALCLFAQSFADPSLRISALDARARTDWSDPITTPTALLDLNTCLLR